MSENKYDESMAKEESFAELLESYNQQGQIDFQPGDRLAGKIIAIGKEFVFVDTGTKIDGAVDISELLDDNGNLPFEEGDQVDLYVVAVKEDEIKLAKALSGIGGLRVLEDAYREAIPVEGTVTGECKGGFQVDLTKKMAFCPISQIDLSYVDRPEDYVGESFQFLITRFEDHGRNIVVSRRRLLEKELKKSRDEFLKTTSIGTVLDAKVTKVMDYGAFVEIMPGLEGLVHVSELSWSRLKKPNDIVYAGDVVTVKLIGKETDADSGIPKLSFSIKQISNDPWETLSEHIKIGEKMVGTASRCMPFGVFIEILPGIEGLVHISEMSYTQRVLKPEDLVSEGDTVDVMVKTVDANNRKIALSMRDAEGDPWIGVDEKYKTGQVLAATIAKKERFGYFISLEPGVTGLLPNSNITKANQLQSAGSMSEGNSIKVIIENINLVERKIKLGLADTSSEENWQTYSNDNSSQMGTLGEKLQQALASKQSKKPKPS